MLLTGGLRDGRVRRARVFRGSEKRLRRLRRWRTLSPGLLRLTILAIVVALLYVWRLWADLAR